MWSRGFLYLKKSDMTIAAAENTGCMGQNQKRKSGFPSSNYIIDTKVFLAVHISGVFFCLILCFF